MTELERRTQADVRRVEAAMRVRGRPESALVSVVIPVYDKWDVTCRCLESLAVCDPHVTLQVIVVDDGSTDQTAYALPLLAGIDVVRNGRNSGFIAACNRGAAIAHGTYIWFLNNDTTLEDGALAALVERLESSPSIGIVGSKLVYPNGVLQEAGGIVFNDANGWNYGRGKWPEQPEYNYARDVDYVSGASLLVRAELFRSLGGFDDRYAPAYYEDADLCFAARQAGFRVTYEPRSVVVHYEGISAGTDLSSGMKRYQPINRATFGRKWSAVLARDHYDPLPENVIAARDRGTFERTILVVDSYVPAHDKEAGSNRLFHLIRGFVREKQRVIFLPDNFVGQQPYCGELQALGVEVLHHTARDDRSWQEQLSRVLPLIDVAWICRPELCSKYLLFIRRNSRATIVYDTIDLHYVRLRREVDVRGSGDDAGWRAMQRLELAAAGAADGTIVVHDIERRVLLESGIERVAVVPTVHDPMARLPRRFSETSGVLFIGGYNHTPNVDAALWLVESIMPIVWQEIPSAHVTLLGSNPTGAVLALASERVTVTGYLEDVEPYFLGARVFVAPLRFGAGIKGKIGHSLSYAVPTVTTPVGAEGFGLIDGTNCRVAADATGFARAILELYTDRASWDKVSANAHAVIEQFSSRNVCAAALTFVRSLASSAGSADPPPSRNGTDVRAGGDGNGLSHPRRIQSLR